MDELRKKIPKVIEVVNCIMNRMGHNFMLSMSRSLQDNFGSKIHTNLPNIGQVMMQNVQIGTLTT